VQCEMSRDAGITKDSNGVALRFEEEKTIGGGEEGKTINNRYANV